MTTNLPLNDNASYDFKLKGEKLTDTTKAPDDSIIQVNNGTIKGYDISF